MEEDSFILVVRDEILRVELRPRKINHPINSALQIVDILYIYTHTSFLVKTSIRLCKARKEDLQTCKDFPLLNTC